MLMRFLDCVDRRDGETAAALFHPDGIWNTASPFGELSGQANIAALINQQLPPRKYASQFLRHKMAKRADPTDLTVITPMGETCRFQLELTPWQTGSESTLVIKKLVRHVL